MMNINTVITFKYIFVIVFTITIMLYFVKWTEKINPNYIKNNLKSEIYQDTKIILFWNSFFGVKDYNFGLGNDPFFKYKCPVYDCFTTADPGWLPIDQYDAIVFHGPEFNPIFNIDSPSSRSGHQRYVYLSQESPQNRPVKSSLNAFFNFTMTHRLDSDIVLNYYAIFDLEGNYTAPQENPKWTVPDFSNLETYKEVNKLKKKAVAWFVSNCGSKNGRESYVEELQNYIQVDIYGGCGPFKCPRINERRCFDLLRTDYYFYLSFENSNCKDYVTEKVSNALLNDVVPVVLGGANYSKFLPPHSYLDASATSAEELARSLQYLIDNPESYAKYFWWKNYYKVDQSYPAFCKLCEILHDRSVPSKSYNIHEWWHGDQSNPICR
ncbi:alpha-(1,3)-fucosyltransferase C-like [Arctopsyche grandis]|uniref:alpha-(1,3)-fucosyltransferase C-like n=1 Tax=Arctopsyche grandis TaxID=121162 RepID=UPI00406D8ADF